jgi:cell fate regulator YaaT (PSP1 superfamily)
MHVVVRTDRGIEDGEVLCEATEKTLAFLKAPVQGELLRIVSDADHEKLREVEQARRREFDACDRFIADMGLPMKLVDVEHLLGGERIVFFFMADNRVDFRELVKTLAREFHTRIEMRQIGVRDETKLLADYGDCGLPTCCNTHLTAMPPVSMRMAKLQKATLDPSKISGRCGRLKCCLRYESDHYEEAARELPQVGARIVTRQGSGRVLSQILLARRVIIQDDESRRFAVDAEDILTVITKHGNGTLTGEQQTIDERSGHQAN